MGARENRIMLDFDLNELPPSENVEQMEVELFAVALEREAANLAQARVHHGMLTRSASGARSAPVRPTPLRTPAPFGARSNSTATTPEDVQSIEAHSWSSNASKINSSKPKYGSPFGALALQNTLSGDAASVNSPQMSSSCIQNNGQNLLSPASGYQHMIGPSQPGPVPLQSGTDSSDSSPVQQLVHALMLIPSDPEAANLLASRELAFTNTFPFNSQRCSPAAPCTSCLAFFEVPLPAELLKQIGLHPGARFFGVDEVEDEDSPPDLRNLSEEEAAKRKLKSRHGPKSKSSEYRGVTFYKRTQRWEAHIWHEGGQVYMGASVTKDEAARAYDKAAIILTGVHTDINFKPEDYQGEMSHMYKLNKEQLVIYLRRDSRGYGAQVSYPGVKRGKKNTYQAVFEKENVLGIYATEEDAARAVFNEAVRRCDGGLASWIMSTHHVRNMPSYAMQRLAALNPEAAVLQSIASASKTKNNPRKSKMRSPTIKKKRSPRSATKKKRINTLALQFG